MAGSMMFIRAGQFHRGFVGHPSSSRVRVEYHEPSRETFRSVELQATLYSSHPDSEKRSRLVDAGLPGRVDASAREVAVPWFRHSARSVVTPTNQISGLADRRYSFLPSSIPYPPRGENALLEPIMDDRHDVPCGSGVPLRYERHDRIQDERRALARFPTRSLRAGLQSEAL